MRGIPLLDRSGCVQEDEHVTEMDRFWFNLNWYLYKLRAWWRGA